MTDQPTETAAAPTPAREGPRRLSLIAGMVAMIVASLRFLMGAGELDAILMAMGDDTRQPLVTILWHSMTAIFFLGGLLTLLSAWQSRGAARATALYTTVIFATVAIIMLTVAAGSVAGPTAFWPVFPLTAAAIASFVAWIRA